MFYRLPPAGEPISQTLAPLRRKHSIELFDPFVAKFYGSGTQALAAAVLAALRSKPTPDPEVLLPAYTCPAVVSAVLYAGATPVLVDFEQDRPWMNLVQLQNLISERTVAIIAVHLFGIPERLAKICEIARSTGVTVIVDSAQRAPERDEPDEHADFVVLSFGRGKPLSLLGGGAVLVKKGQCATWLPDPNRATVGVLAEIRARVKFMLYNRFLSPRFYWLPAGIPFLHLGETRFTRLDAIDAMNQTLLNRLPVVLADYSQQSGTIERKIAHMLSQFGSADLVDLPTSCGSGRWLRLSRYPILVLSSRLRDRLFEQLDRAGLGASKMYPAPLPQIRGLSDILETQKIFPASERFSRSILTLPTHSGVTPETVTSIDEIFRQTFKVAH